MSSLIHFISGPTGIGKSDLAIKLAKKINGKIINADSMQVYENLNILTARPSEKEGRLWISIKDALSATGSDSKEGILQAIGSAWNSQQSEAKAAEKAAKISGPKTGDKRGRSQRKSFKGAKGSKPSERRKRRK